jgi:hypothetical protein
MKDTTPHSLLLYVVSLVGWVGWGGVDNVGSEAKEV